MSGVAEAGPGDELVVLAGEYVLGTLPSDEALHLAREAATDPALAGAIADWERRLAPLLAAVPAVPPPATLWPRIAASTRAGTAPAPDTLQATQPTPLRPEWPGRLRRWQAATAAGFLLAASVAGIAILRPLPAASPLAVLAPIGARNAAFVLEARTDGRTTLVPIAPAPVPAGRDLELWSLAAGAKVPRPVGLLPAAGTTLAADRIPAGPVQILVSLEPAGGSPTGLPTGPVLYAAMLPRRE